MTCPVYQLLDAQLPPGCQTARPSGKWNRHMVGMGKALSAANLSSLVPFGFHRNLQHPRCFNSNEVTTHGDHQAQGRASRKIRGWRESSRCSPEPTEAAAAPWRQISTGYAYHTLHILIAHSQWEGGLFVAGVWLKAGT